MKQSDIISYIGPNRTQAVMMRRFWGMVDEEPVIQGTERGLAVAITSIALALTATWLVQTLIGINLPFLFCLAAVIFNASRSGLSAGIFTGFVSLTGTIMISGADRSIVNARSVAIVAVFCTAISAGGEVLLRSRRREYLSALDASRRERILQLMFDDSPAITLIINADGDIVAANEAACRIFEHSRDDLIGYRLKDIILLGGSSKNPFLQTAILPSGLLLHLNFTETPLMVGGRTYQMVYVRDETGAIEAAEALRTTQRELYRIARATALGQLGSSIAHELNQPLAFVANYAETAQALLAKEPPDILATRSAINDALSQVFRAAAVLKRLRNFVGRKPPTMIHIDASSMMKDAARLGLLAVEDARAKLEIDMSKLQCSISADAVQIQQVVLNLIINAADAVRDSNDRIIHFIGWCDTSDDVTFAVEDSGVGISPDLRHNIFTPFQSTKIDGVGIGLAICRAIVEAHGGRIWCDGDTVLGGARFLFTLPRSDLGGNNNA